jgi:hypothetical protein
VSGGKSHENSGKIPSTPGQPCRIPAFNPEIPPEFSVISISSIEFYKKNPYENQYVDATKFTGSEYSPLNLHGGRPGAAYPGFFYRKQE